MKTIGRIILSIIVLAGLAAAGGIVIRRAAHERAINTIEIVVDYNDVQRLAPITRGGVAQTLERFSEAGASSVGIYEDNLADMADSGQVSLLHVNRRSELPPEVSLPESVPLKRGLIAMMNDDASAGRVTRLLKSYFGASSCPLNGICVLPLSARDSREITAGFAVPDTGMAVSLRPYNDFVETPDSVKEKFREWDSLKKKGTVVFDGTAVLGNPNMLNVVAGEVKARPGLVMGVVEMTEQDGAAALAARIPGHVVQVHSITEKEMTVMKEGAAVARLMRAVRERKVQVLYLRLFSRDSGLSRADALEKNIRYVKSVAAGVRAQGKTVGLARPMPELVVPWWSRALVVCGAAALVLLLAGVAVRFPPMLGVVACAAVFLGFPAAATSGRDILVLKLAALATACFVPGLAASAFFLTPYTHYDGPGQRMPLTKNLLSWLAVCLLTATGGLMIAAMLASRTFFLRLDVFAGVKLALIFPFLVTAWCFVRASGMTLKEFFDSPVRYVEAAAAAVLLGAVALYLMRSGNQSSASPGGAELQMRNWLEAVLMVRPRTKEFMIGHPAMILLGMLPFYRKNMLYLAVLFVGVIGQASLINTFCHLHTPIGITIARVVLGVLLGMIIGLVARVALLAAGRLFKIPGL